MHYQFIDENGDEQQADDRVGHQPKWEQLGLNFHCQPQNNVRRVKQFFNKAEVRSWCLDVRPNNSEKSIELNFFLDVKSGDLIEEATYICSMSISTANVLSQTR